MKLKNKIIMPNILLLILTILILVPTFYFSLKSIYTRYSNTYLKTITLAYAKGMDDHIDLFKTLATSINISIEEELDLIQDDIYQDIANQLKSNKKITQERKSKLNIILNEMQLQNINDNFDILNKIGLIHSEIKDNLKRIFLKLIENKNIISDNIDNIYFTNKEGDIIVSNNDAVLNNNIKESYYYKKVFSNNLDYYIESFEINKFTNKASIFISTPIIYNKEKIGLMVQVIDIKKYTDKFKNTNFLNDGSIDIFTKDKEIVFTNKQDLLEGKTKNLLFETDEWSLATDNYVNYEYNDLKLYSFMTYLKEIDWVMIINIPKSSLFKRVTLIGLNISIIAAFLTIIIVILNYFLSKKRLMDIMDIIEIARNLSIGNIAIDIPEKNLKSNDELGQLVRYLNETKNNMQNTIATIQVTSNDISDNTSVLDSSSSSIANFSKEQSSRIENITNSVNKIFLNLKYNSDNIKTTKSLANKTSQTIQEGSIAVNDMIEAVYKINSKIQDIQEIATNTNLLALNASIEAVRTGEAGKGFAVVASEIGKLSKSSNKSAVDITNLINDTLIISEKAGNILDSIVPEVDKTAILIEDISNISEEQNVNIGHIKKSISLLNNNINLLARFSNTLSPVSRNLKNNSESFENIIKFFKIS